MRNPIHAKSLAGVLVGVLLASLAACGSGNPTPTPAPTTSTITPTPSATGWVPELSHDEAYRRLPPLEGSESSPLYWEVPELDDPDQEAAILTMRRLVALEEHHFSTWDVRPYEHADLYYYLATQRYLDLIMPLPETVNPNPPAQGPQWHRVMDLRPQSKTELHIDVCVDIGWLLREPRDTPATYAHR